MRRALQLASDAPVDERIVMIKSWNEWAEGNYLEPDTEVGDARLKALAHEVSRAEESGRVQVPPLARPDASAVRRGHL